MRRNFTQLTDEQTAQLREALVAYYRKTDGRNAAPDAQPPNLAMRLSGRLNSDRHEFIPWMASMLDFGEATVLEIGCGTGPSTVSMAEQGARVIGVDLNDDAIDVARVRCELHGVSERVQLVHSNATEIASLFPDERFDLVVIFAALEHMTLPERYELLRALWDLLRPGSLLCVTETPNRLWFYDSHTAHMPFYHWLPDEMAFELSRQSPRAPFNSLFRELDEESMLAFRRKGRGVSFHEFDLAIGTDNAYEIAGDKVAYLASRNPAVLAKRLLAGDGRRERLLNSYAPDRDRAFFRENLDLALRKV